MNYRVTKTACGPVRGIVREDSVLYRGIPFCTAERFEKPVLVEDFAPFADLDGVLDATGPEWDCCQLSAFLDEREQQNVTSFYKKEFRGEDREVNYCEDVMSLNVVTPAALSVGLLPVLCFIHGGGFETGTVGELPYGDTAEYARRDIIYVSLGHRLNVFSLYESGNYGLHDMVAGLMWIREHIASFGGDPSRVTVIGQSAGAMSITDLLLTKCLKGLVQGAVCMSGGGALPKFVPPLTKEQSAPFWAKVREAAGCDTEEEIRTVGAETLWHAWFEVSNSKAAALSTKTPGIDGEIIPDLPANCEKKQLDLDIPLIFGLTSQDFMPVPAYEMALKRGLRAEKIGYPPFWGYFFDHALPGNSFKAFHACDLWYVFGNMDKSWRPFTDEDRALSAKMIDCIANFVKTGSPNGTRADGGELPEWKPVGRKQKGFMRFDVEGRCARKYAYPAECRRKALKTMLWDKGPM